MNKYTFSTQNGKAYYCNSIPGFIRDTSASIVGQLVQHAFEINKDQSDAWENQILQLQERLKSCGMEGDIIFEYDIVRLGKRIDVILLIRHMVFSLEFKNGKDVFTAQDAQQAEDYAVDIKNFHKESEDLYVCPILIATNAPKYKKPQSTGCYPDKDIDEAMIRSCPRCHERLPLHLKTSIRSFRADKQCQFVDNLLDNNPAAAKRIYDEICAKYPVYVTRDYSKAKAWVRGQVRGSQRCGVLACSSAQRLKPEGIYVPTEIDVKNWFLAPSDDLRSSNMLEVVASEFKVQGLEIDWAIVCWDQDLRRKNHKEWDHYSFRGTKWMHRNKAEQKRYLVNSYRVLLTRARQGMVIFVPKGVDAEEDPTRKHTCYDEIFNYLKLCGIYG